MKINVMIIFLISKHSIMATVSMFWVFAALACGFIGGQMFCSNVPSSERAGMACMRKDTFLKQRPAKAEIQEKAAPIAPLRPIGQKKKREAFCRATATQSVGT